MMLPDVEMFAPTTESWPPTDETFTPTICAAVNAAWRSVTYWATVSGGFAVTAGAVIVAVPVAVGPVIVRFVPGFTVAVVPPLDPKVYLMVVVPKAVFDLALRVSGSETLYDHALVPVLV